MSASNSTSITTMSGLVLNKVNSNKLDYLYEVSVEPEVVNHTSFPVINPHTIFQLKRKEKREISQVDLLEFSCFRFLKLAFEKLLYLGVEKSKLSSVCCI